MNSCITTPLSLTYIRDYSTEAILQKTLKNNMRRKKNIFSTYLEYLFFLMAMGIVGVLPSRLCFKAAGLAGLLFFFVDVRHRKRSLQHILHAGMAKDWDEATDLARRNFIHLAKVGVEIFKCRELIKTKDISRTLSITGPSISRERFFSTCGKSEQAIIICAHFGNWEIAGQLIAMSSGLPLLGVFRPFDNPRIGNYINSRREGGKHEMTEKKGAIRKIISAMKKGWSVAFVADQHANEKEGVTVNYFGHPASTHKAPAMLHLRTGIPLLVLMPRRVSDDFRFEFILSAPIVYSPSGDEVKDVEAITQMFTSEIENVVRRYPEQWMWAHRRWTDINRDR